jgi:hypothetical protein
MEDPACMVKVDRYRKKAFAQVLLCIGNFFTISLRNFSEFLDCCFVAKVYFGALSGTNRVFPEMARRPPIKIDNIF